MGQYLRMVYLGIAGIPQAPLPQQPVTPPGYIVVNQDYVISPFQQQPQQLVGNTLQPPQQNFVYASQTTPTQTLTTPVTIPQSNTPTPMGSNVAVNSTQPLSETVTQTSETASRDVGKAQPDSPLAQPLDTSSDDTETVYLKLSKADLKRPEIKALIVQSPEKTLNNS